MSWCCRLHHETIFLIDNQGIIRQRLDDLREVLHFKGMFLGGDVVGSVIGTDRSAELSDDPATVNLAAYPMDGHSGLGLPRRLDSLVDMMTVHAHASEFRQKGGMKVDHPVVIFMDQEVRDDKEETRQNDEVD